MVTNFVLLQLMGEPTPEQCAAMGVGPRGNHVALPDDERNMRIKRRIKPVPAVEHVIDLLNRLLKYEPNRRESAADASNHVLFDEIKTAGARLNGYLISDVIGGD
jgi:hypothetical protein